MGINHKLKKVVNPQTYIRAAKFVKHKGFNHTFLKTAGFITNRDYLYQQWRKHNKLTEQDLQKQRDAKFKNTPKFSIVVPLFNTPKMYLEKLVASVTAQTYENWELVLANGSGKNEAFSNLLSTIATEDERIKIVQNTNKLNISDNTNSSINNATGDWIVFCDHDDELAPNALYECANAINKDSEIDFIYTDEDKIDTKSKHYFQPHFKSDFNIDMLRSVNYICHMVAVKKSLQNKVGFLNAEHDGAQDYDFVLRCAEQANKIYHIPKVLYHWRAHTNSTAGKAESKNYAFDAGTKVLQAHYDRLNIKATVEATQYEGIYRTRYKLTNEPLVSILIPNKDHVADLKRCIASIQNCNAYKNYEIVIVENNSKNQETFEYSKSLAKDKKVKVVEYKTKEFNYSDLNNFGAQHCSGEYLLLLNNDTEFIEPGSINEMLSICQREDVGAVGAKMYYPDGTIQHAGVILGIGGIAAHAFAKQPGDRIGYMGRAVMVHDLSCVTAACMMVKRSTFSELKGFDENLKVNFNDVDFCLRLRQKNKLIVFTPYAQLVHFESKSRGRLDTPEKLAAIDKEIEYFDNLWHNEIKSGDMYYNCNLSLNDSDFMYKIN